MATALARPQMISLAAGFTDSQTLPVSETRRLLKGILGRGTSARAALQYGTTQGDAALRRLAARRLADLDAAAWAAVESGPLPGRGYDAERMFITSGSQQLLYVLSECLCDPGDIVLVEDPTYFVYLGIAQSHGLRCRGIRLTEEGLDVEHLGRVLEGLQRSGELSRVKLLYLVSYHQNPTGITTAWERKREALAVLRHFERAAGHPIYLVEDAAYRELRFAGLDVPSALAVPRARERVIYAGTFSKPFATGVRVGFGVLPDRLLRVVLRVKGNHDFGTSNLIQQLLRRALADGSFERHVEVLRARYARKARTMVQALRRHFPEGVHWVEPRGGLYVWARLPGCWRTGMSSPLFREALARNVLYIPGGLCYAPDPTRRRPDHEMRLSFGSASLEDIREGIARLGATVAGVSGRRR